VREECKNFAGLPKESNVEVLLVSRIGSDEETDSRVESLESDWKTSVNAVEEHLYETSGSPEIASYLRFAIF
jgi:hypothetical protein